MVGLNKLCELRGTPERTILIQVNLHQSVLKGATTISKESTLKWVEAHGTCFIRDDIVSSTQECVAVNNGQELTTLVEDKMNQQNIPPDVKQLAISRFK